jgi:hypothetical protein
MSSTATVDTSNPSSCTDSGYMSSTPIIDKSDLDTSNYRVSKTIHCCKCYPSLQISKLTYFPKAALSSEYNCRFRALTDLHYGSKFCKEVRSGGAENSIISLKCMMLGESEHTAKAWVVVFCAKELVRKVKAFFKKSSRRKDFQPHNGEPDEPCLNIAVYGRAPLAMNLEWAPDVFCGSLVLYGNTLCGQLILVRSGEKARICTMGGLVEVKRSDGSPILYGMTTAHGIFLRTEREPTSLEEELDSSEEERSDSDIDELHYHNDFDSDRDSSDDGDSSQTDPLMLANQRAGHDELKSLYDDSDFDHEFGKMAHYSLEADWALFTLNPGFQKPNYGPNSSVLKSVESVTDFVNVAPRRALMCGNEDKCTIGNITSTSFCLLPGSETLLEVFNMCMEPGQSK